MPEVYEKVGNRFRHLKGYANHVPMYQWMPEGWMPGADDEVQDTGIDEHKKPD